MFCSAHSCLQVFTNHQQLHSRRFYFTRNLFSFIPIGVDSACDLKWDTHINRITASAINKTIGFIRRNLGPCTIDAKSTAYKTLVRPTLKYWCAVWDPHHKFHIKKLAMVPRRAARMVTNDYNRESGVSQNMIKWENLSDCRKTAKLTILHKAKAGHLAIPVLNYLCPASRITRTSHTNSFSPISCRLDTSTLCNPKWSETGIIYRNPSLK